MEWVLIIYIYAGAFARGDSVALASVPMMTEEACRRAQEDAKELTKEASLKVLKTVCLRTRQ